LRRVARILCNEKSRQPATKSERQPNTERRGRLASSPMSPRTRSFRCTSLQIPRDLSFCRDALPQASQRTSTSRNPLFPRCFLPDEQLASKELNMFKKQNKNSDGICTSKYTTRLYCLLLKSFPSAFQHVSHRSPSGSTKKKNEY